MVDVWGNYFDIHYNNDQGSAVPSQSNNFTASGIWVSEIDYTGTLTNSNCTGAFSCARLHLRVGDVPVRMSSRHSLESRRAAQNSPEPAVEIDYHAAGNVLTHVFRYGDAQPGPVLPGPGGCSVADPKQAPVPRLLRGIDVHEADNLPLEDPSDHSRGRRTRTRDMPCRTMWVGPGLGLNGTQFVDINGDGRADFVVARAGRMTDTLINTGFGWGPAGRRARCGAFPIDLSELKTIQPVPGSRTWMVMDSWTSLSTRPTWTCMRTDIT